MVIAGRKLGRSYLCEVRGHGSEYGDCLPTHVKFLRSAKDHVKSHHSARVVPCRRYTTINTAPSYWPRSCELRERVGYARRTGRKYLTCTANAACCRTSHPCPIHVSKVSAEFKIRFLG